MAGRSLKSAPRRLVRHIDRRGDWGDVTYHHHLSCGHTEIRKRKTPHVVLACSGCLTAQQFAAGLTLTPERHSPPAFSDVDENAGLETEVGRVRAGLAKRFEVSSESVDVALRPDGIAYVLVFLDRSTALRLARVDTTADAG